MVGQLMRAVRRGVFAVVVAVLCALLSPAVGWADPGGGPRAVTVPSVAAKRPAWQVTNGVPSPGLPPPQRNSGASPALLACDTHAVGSWGYTDQNLVQHTGMNMQVQVRDLLTGAVIAALTDSAGRFDICFGAAQFTQLYITFKAENAAWRVQNGTDVFNWSTPVRANPVAGSIVDFGRRGPDAAGNRAAHAFDAGNDTWLAAPHSNACWDPKDTTCRQVRIDFTDTRSDGQPYYDQTANVVHTLPETVDGPMEIVHEIGHAIMDDLYNDAFPSTAGCPDQHPPNTASTAVCAWIEGWADFVSLAVYHTPIFVFHNGGSRNFELPTWGAAGIDNGDITQQRVTGALWDVIDSSGSGEQWDQHSEGFGAAYLTLAHHVDNTFASYWNSRAADGFDVSDATLGSLYQNTIDYQYRRQLLEGQGQFLATYIAGTAQPPLNFGFSTAVHSWSVVAMRPGPLTDYNLLLFDERAQTSPTSLANSFTSNQEVEFIAIDSNLRPLDDYYPRVFQFRGPGNYTIEYAAGFTTLQPASSNTFHFDDSHVAAVQDTVLTAGVPVTITLTEQDPVSFASLFVMGDDPNTPSTFVEGRASALASAEAPANGGPVSVTFTPPRTGRYGVVVTGDNGGGTYTLTRS